MDVLNVLGGMYCLPWMYFECDGDVAMDVYCTPCTNVYLARGQISCMILNGSGTDIYNIVTKCEL